MLKKVLSKSGHRILKAIKKLSTMTKSKSSQSVTVGVSNDVSSDKRTWRFDHEAVSLSWSLASLDTKSIDTYLTLVSDENGTGTENLTSHCYDDDENKKCYCCCCCVEYEAENQRNENRENEMFVYD